LRGGEGAHHRHPGASVDVLVTDHGIAVNPARQDLIDNLSWLA
jgi:citrate lyase alpha subunit